MKRFFLFLTLLFGFLISNAQVLRPSQLPTINAPGRFDITGYQMDSAFLSIIRATFPAKYPSLIRKTVDSAFWYTNGGWAGAPWWKIIDQKDTASMLSPYLKNSDTAYMLANYITTNGYGLLKTGKSLSVDTLKPNGLTTRERTQQQIDSVIGLISSSGGGTVLSVSTTDGIGIISSVSNPTSTPDISIRVDTSIIIPYTDTLKNNGVATKSYVDVVAQGLGTVQMVNSGFGILNSPSSIVLNGSVNVDTNVIATKYYANTNNIKWTDTGRVNGQIWTSYLGNKTIDSLSSVKLNISDTGAMLNNYARSGQYVKIDSSGDGSNTFIPVSTTPKKYTASIIQQIQQEQLGFNDKTLLIYGDSVPKTPDSIALQLGELVHIEGYSDGTQYFNSAKDLIIGNRGNGGARLISAGGPRLSGAYGYMGAYGTGNGGSWWSATDAPNVALSTDFSSENATAGTIFRQYRSSPNTYFYNTDTANIVSYSFRRGATGVKFFDIRSDSTVTNNPVSFGSVTVKNISNASGNFATYSANGTLQKRTPSEVLSDIDAASTGSVLLKLNISDTSSMLSSYYNKTASDARFAHLTGNESIAGTKTFSNTIVAGFANGNIRMTGATTDGFLGVAGSGSELYVADWTNANKGFKVDLTNGALTQLGSGAMTWNGSVTANSFIKSGGTSSQSLMADGSVLTIISSVYTPTSSNLSNLSLATPAQMVYTRVGSNVQWSVSVSCVVSSTGSTSFELSLPISSDFTLFDDASGAGSVYSDAKPVQVLAESTNNTLNVSWTAATTGSQQVVITGQYVIK